MEILRTIALYSEVQKKDFLLIGGHALNYYGLSRQTGDIDFIVQKDDHDYWKDMFDRLKYSCDQDDQNFARFKPEQFTNWPIDLMYVDNPTFEALMKTSKKDSLANVDIHIVSPLHLAMLKIHALKYYQEHRFTKDYQDLIWLLRNPLRDISKQDLENICQNYGSPDLYKKINGDLN